MVQMDAAPVSTRQWTQADPWTILDDGVAHGSSLFNEGGATFFFE